MNVDVGPQCLTDLQVDYLRGAVQAIRVQDGLLVQGVVESQLGLECVRCLEPFSLVISSELEETYRLSGAGSRPGESYVVGDDGWLDLDPVLREQAWVDIPMKPLCRSDCKGLCPECGVNLNHDSCDCDRTEVDPRLAMLRDLIN
jgi:uncharacterized protein